MNILQNTIISKSNNKRVREEDYQEEQDFFASFFDVQHPPKQAKVTTSNIMSSQSEQDSLTPSTTQQQVLSIFDDIDFSSLNSFLNDSSDDSDFFYTTITAMDSDKTQIENLRQYLEFL